jgi:hypothetical protein
LRSRFSWPEHHLGESQPGLPIGIRPSPAEVVKPD